MFRKHPRTTTTLIPTLVAALFSSQALAQRVTCTASLNTASGLLSMEAATISGVSTALSLARDGSIPRGFKQSSASTTTSTCLDAATLSSGRLTIPDIKIGSDYYAATLKLDSATNLYSMDTAAINARLVPESGFRATQASNPFASVSTAGVSYLGYMDRASRKTMVQSAADGLSFSGATELTYLNRSVDSRKTLMPDGVTWRLYEWDQSQLGFISYSSTDGNQFTLESGSRLNLGYGPIDAFDSYVAGGEVVLLYLADVAGKKNLYMARSADNGVTFSIYRGDVLGDLATGASFVDIKTILLADGRRRLVAVRSSEIHSFISADGLTYTREPGVRLKPSDFAAVGLTIYSLNDPVLVQTKEGGFRLYAAAATTAAADETAGVLDWAIVSALWSGPELAAPGNVTVSNVSATTVGGNNISSSTKLALSWSKPAGFTPAPYVVTAVDSVTGSNTTYRTSDTALTVTGLKSDTEYKFVVKACRDAMCKESTTSAEMSGKTSAEYWQLQGSGATVAGLTKTVSDGNVRLAVMRYGSDAPDALKNRLQFYYGPNSLGIASGLAPALSNSELSNSNTATFLAFTSSAGSAGLQNPSTAATLIKEVNAGQALPLSAAAGGYVRLYFEANGTDGKARIYSINSRDGYTGMDFNSDSTSAVCKTKADYSTGGGCEPTVVIPVEGDTGGFSKIPNARQFKIGFPMQADWRWNEDVGTFMLFTTDKVTGCSVAPMNHGYAVWSGSKWEVQYESNGCPKLFKYAQAMTPLHLGGANYKAYYGDTSDATGRITSSPLPFLGPKKVMYSNSTDGSTVKFDDWEGTAKARGINFLWPDGTLLDAKAEGYIDDFMVAAPTGSLDYQVFYLAITDGSVAPLLAAAFLLNP